MPAKSSPRKSSRSRKVAATGSPPRKQVKALSWEDIEELEKREEPLRKKYMRYVIEREDGSLAFSHPFAFAYGIRLDRCAPLHHRIETMEALAAKLLKEGNVHDFVLCHTKAFRVYAFRNALRKIGANIKDKDYWETVRWLYQTNENPSGYWHTFRRWFASRRKNREYLMKPEERDLFRRLPDSFTVYRGYSQFDGAGMSWTLDRGIANWFAHRWDYLGQPRVITGVVRRGDVLALLTAANEAEVLVPWGLVTDQVHGPADAENQTHPFRHRFDFESFCVRESPRPTSRHRPAKTTRKSPPRARVRPR